LKREKEYFMIVALAGRRIDGADAKESRFPLANLDLVRVRTRTFLEQEHATALVSSAACGADLIALSEAGHLGLRRRVILPFGRERFRETSVIDRPGDWGTLFDQILDEVEAAGDLVVLQAASGEEAYAVANGAILNETMALATASDENAIAILIWDGASRGANDLTEQFGREARKHGLGVKEISTI
jgi:hypothetical protein